MYMRHIRPTNPTVTADDFRRYISEFTPDDYPDDVLEEWIEVARNIYNWRKLGIVYLTAHLIALAVSERADACLLYTSPSPRDRTRSRMPSSA